MSFRLPSDADKWFSNLEGQDPHRVKFDFYYICLILGLALGIKKDVDGQEFIDYFVDDYKLSHRLIVGLLILAELKNFGIDISEKKEVRKFIANILDPNSINGLTADGCKLLNMYASSGFYYLQQNRQKPYHWDELLADYYTILQTEISTNELWTSFIAS